ncbi:homeobox protein ceh-38-like isoform X1 [Clavelina lepadiformis]|uniref:homeobox protein ceh-38-like isoform X1 n=1 Tax=Clavelina lepadiformis TaxID=159417 RepID=UPI0040414A85
MDQDLNTISTNNVEKGTSIACMLSPIKAVLEEGNSNLMTGFNNDGATSQASMIPEEESKLLLPDNIQTLNSSEFSERIVSCGNTVFNKVGASNLKPAGYLPRPSCNIHEFTTNCKALDTHVLARQVKDILIENNIGQRIFGQAILGLTQGSVSDLLSHPKSWECLSLKGREPFIKMYLWLKNPENIERLKTIKTEKLMDSTIGSSKCTVSSNLLSACNNIAPVTKKKSRVVLSTEEKLILLQAYAVEPYPSHNTVNLLATKLNKKSSTIVNWFHNYRSRVKRGFFSLEDASKNDDVLKLSDPDLGTASFSSLSSRSKFLGQREVNNCHDRIKKEGVHCLTGSHAKQKKVGICETSLAVTNPVVIAATVILTNSSPTANSTVLSNSRADDSVDKLLLGFCQNSFGKLPYD